MESLATITMLLLAGLAGSLHCIGMCGPILLGFSQAFGRSARQGSGVPQRAAPAGSSAASGAAGMSAAAVVSSTAITSSTPSTASTASTSLTPGSIVSSASSSSSPGRSLALDFTWYHVGRIWTYGLLGLLAGLLGHGLRAGSPWADAQGTAALVLSLLVVIVGLALLGVIPGVDLDKRFHGCGFKRFGPARWFRSLLGSRGVAPRLLLGAVMGLLPCGLVYAALLIAATLPHPALSAAGMLAFGLGTVPSMSGVLFLSRILPARWRSYGTRLAAVLVVLTGVWMTWRAMLLPAASCTCHG